MAQSENNDQVHLQVEEAKKHGDPLEEALETSESGKGNHAIPAPDNGDHPRSHAAHLGSVQDHTKPAGNLRQGSSPGERREPPMVVSRVGKQHK